MANNEETEIVNARVSKVNITKLCLSVDNYATTSPGVSRFYVEEIGKLLVKSGSIGLCSSDVCSYCGSVFRPGNHTRKLEPRMKLTKKIQQIQRKSRRKPLGRFEWKMLKDYTDGFNKMAITCLLCNKLKRHVIYSRENRNTQKLKLQIEEKQSKKKKKKSKPELNAGLTIPGKHSGDATETEQPRPLQNKSKPSNASFHGQKKINQTKTTSIRDLFKTPTKTGKKGKKSFLSLQQILASEQTDSRTKSSGSLASFLDSL